MSSKNRLLICNWKMNGSLKLCQEFADIFCFLSASNIKKTQKSNKKKEYDNLDSLSATVVICPPSIYIPEIAAKIKYQPNNILEPNTSFRQNFVSQSISQQLSYINVILGAQNVAIGPKAQTGEIDCRMLSEFDCRYVILGHSERRRIYGENIDVICAKVVDVLENNMIPIICIGESREIFESSQTIQYIKSEIEVIKKTLLNVTKRNLPEADSTKPRNNKTILRSDLPLPDQKPVSSIVIAYEPVYAIGSGIVPELSHIESVSRLIYQELKATMDQCSYNFNIIYGGSVTSSNSPQILNINYVDGLLLGGASLQLEEVTKISNILLTF